MIKFTIDNRQFKSALRAYKETTRKALPEILNQRAFNIAARAVDSMKPAPGAEQSTRGRIRRYLNEQISTRIRITTLTTSRGRKLHLVSKQGSKKSQLKRVNLIVQMRRARAGLKGLYGPEMAAASGRFAQAAQVGVGFLKSAFLPIIKGLWPLVKFRKVATRFGRISVWPGSDGFGKVDPAKPGWNPFVAFNLRWKVAGTPTKVSRLIVPKLQAAFDAEARELIAHTQRKLQAEANKINARK